jgi:hypothetical protein
VYFAGFLPFLTLYIAIFSLFLFMSYHMFNNFSDIALITFTVTALPIILYL